MKITYEIASRTALCRVGDVLEGQFFVPVVPGSPPCIMLCRYIDKSSVAEFRRGGLRFVSYDSDREVCLVDAELILRPKAQVDEPSDEEMLRRLPALFRPGGEAPTDAQCERLISLLRARGSKP